MGWGQFAVALVVGLGVGSGVTLVAGPEAGVVAGIFGYLGVRLLLATIDRTWSRVSGRAPEAQTRSCPECGRTVRRQATEYLPHCHRCGWHAGWTGVRWLTHSAPGRAFRSSVTLPRVTMAILAVAVLVAGLPGFVPADTTADTPSGGSDTVDGEGSDDRSEADGDGLPDDFEEAEETPGGHPLSGADPQRKDLFVRVLVSDGIEPLSAHEQRRLEEIWAEMPVSNPDGSSGVDIHLTHQQLDDRIESSLDAGEIENMEPVYSQQMPEAAQCHVYGVVLAVPQRGAENAGRGALPGYLSVVDGALTFGSGNTTIRVVTVTHELLHNVVGEFDDGSSHTDRGWLRGDPSRLQTDQFLSNKTARKLSEEGFAGSQYFEENVC